jgi:D-alanyl-D-alanine carboxypeptidase
MKSSGVLVRFACFLGVCSLASMPARAEYCWNETVQYVVVHGDGNVYFTTNKSCPSWCMVNNTWSADQRKQAYAMLLAARTSEKPLTFDWAEHSTSCAGAVPVFSKPVAIIL